MRKVVSLEVAETEKHIWKVKSISAALFHAIGANLFLLKASGKEKLKMAQPTFLISEEKNAKEK